MDRNHIMLTQNLAGEILEINIRMTTITKAQTKKMNWMK